MENITMVLHLNARLQPIHRGEIYEDPIDEVLHAYKIGEVTGGGTLQEASGEIKSCDVNYVISELDKLMKDCGERYSHWEGSSETALYYYGKNFKEMKANIEEFIKAYPLCEKCRVVQIA